MGFFVRSPIKLGLSIKVCVCLPPGLLTRMILKNLNQVVPRIYILQNPSGYGSLRQEILLLMISFFHQLFRSDNT